MQFGPLVSLSQFAPGMGDDQLMRATGYIQPLITNLFEEVTFELAALTPPTAPTITTTHGGTRHEISSTKQTRASAKDAGPVTAVTKTGS